MSRERARRREARQAESARRAEIAREQAMRAAEARRRRDRRRAALRTVLPWTPGQRWSRRTRGQRAAVAATLFGLAILVYLMVGSWPTRIALLLAATLITPAAITLFLDRSSR